MLSCQGGGNSKNYLPRLLLKYYFNFTEEQILEEEHILQDENILDHNLGEDEIEETEELIEEEVISDFYEGSVMLLS